MRYNGTCVCVCAGGGTKSKKSVRDLILILITKILQCKRSFNKLDPTITVEGLLNKTKKKNPQKKQDPDFLGLPHTVFTGPQPQALKLSTLLQRWAWKWSLGATTNETCTPLLKQYPRAHNLQNVTVLEWKRTRGNRNYIMKKKRSSVTVASLAPLHPAPLHSGQFSPTTFRSVQPYYIQVSSALLHSGQFSSVPLHSAPLHSVQFSSVQFSSVQFRSAVGTETTS